MLATEKVVVFLRKRGTKHQKKISEHTKVALAGGQEVRVSKSTLSSHYRTDRIGLDSESHFY